MRARLMRVWHFGQRGRSITIERGQTCGNRNNQACDSLLLVRDGKLHCVIALLAFERAHIEARLSRLNFGKSHRLTAFAARETPISATLNSGSGCVESMVLPCVGREHAALSVTGMSHGRGR
jgi:hypothetical protein